MHFITFDRAKKFYRWLCGNVLRRASIYLLSFCLEPEFGRTFTHAHKPLAHNCVVVTLAAKVYYVFKIILAAKSSCGRALIVKCNEILS
jgi:hypothetical protein